MKNAYEREIEFRFWVTEEGFGLNSQFFTRPFPLSELTDFFGCEPSILPGPAGRFVYARWRNSNIEATIDLTLNVGPLVYSLSWKPNELAHWIECNSELQYEFTPILRDELVSDDDGKIRPEVCEKRFLGAKREYDRRVYWNCSGALEAARGRVWAYADIGPEGKLTGFHAYLSPRANSGNRLGSIFSENGRSASPPDYSIEVRDQNSYRKGFQMEVGEQLAKLTIGLLRAIITTIVVVGFTWWMLNKLLPIDKLLEALSQ